MSIYLLCPTNRSWLTGWWLPCVVILLEVLPICRLPIFFFCLLSFFPFLFFSCTGVEILYENFVYNNQLRVTPSPTYSASIELTIFLIETHRLPAQLLYFPTDFGGRVELRTKLSPSSQCLCFNLCAFYRIMHFYQLALRCTSWPTIWSQLSCNFLVFPYRCQTACRWNDILLDGKGI